MTIFPGSFFKQIPRNIYFNVKQRHTLFAFSKRIYKTTKQMSRHFNSYQDFNLCQKASMTVRVIDVDPGIQFFAKKRTPRRV